MQRRKMTGGKSPAQKMAKNMSVFAGIVCIIVIGIMFVYHQHKNSDKSEWGANASSEVEKLSTKDLEVAYPETPSEVMKLYGRICQCMYNTDMSDEECEKLLTQLRMLYSASLLEQNSLEEQKDNLLGELKEFQSKKRKIVNYSVDKSSSVKYKEIEGKECAYVQMSFFMSEKGTYSKSFQNYVLVKEENEWKILAFKKDADAKGQKKEKEKS